MTEDISTEGRKLLAEGTPRPWRVSTPPGGAYPYIQSQHVRHPNASGAWADVGVCAANNYDNEPNAALIAFAVNHLGELLDAYAELRRVRRVAETKTAENWLKDCSDNDKRLTFSLFIEDSDRRKKAEADRDRYATAWGDVVRNQTEADAEHDKVKADRDRLATEVERLSNPSDAALEAGAEAQEGSILMDPLGSFTDGVRAMLNHILSDTKGAG